MPISARSLNILQDAGAVALSDGIKSLDEFPGLPIDQLTFPDESSFLDEIGVVGFSTAEKPDSTTFGVDLLLATEIVLGLPGLDGVELAIGTGAGAGVLLHLEQEIGPNVFEFRAQIEAALRFSRWLLRPVQKLQGKWEEIPDGHCEIALSAKLVVDGDRDVSIVGPGAFSLGPATIGETGIVIEADNVTPVFSSKATLPTNRPPEIVGGWQGIFIARAAIHFPDSWNLPLDGLEFLNCYIGSGGFTGEIQKSWPTSNPKTGELFGLPFTLTKIHIAFRQNALVGSSLAGTIQLPFFEQPVGVDLSLNLDGSFSVALAAVQPPGVISDSGLITFEKKGLLKMTLDSIRFEIDDGLLTVKLSGQITPLAGADKGLKWPTFDVQELSVNSRGEVEVAGGWIDLPKAYTLNFHLFKLEITKFGIGRTDEGEKFIGFSGGLDLVKGIPAGVSVEGLRITWTDPLHPRITMKGVEVELTIPNTLEFKGSVSYEEKGANLRAFTGELKLRLPAMNNLALDAKVVFGSDLDAAGQRFKYFALYFEGELGTGFPLWSTGLALGAFSGLFSVNYAPDKPQEWLWYSIDPAKGSWFHKPPKGVTDLVRKWAPEAGARGLGAGVTIQTYPNARAFNGKFLLLLLIPGPVLMIEGRSNILKDPGAADEPLFHSLVVLDLKAGYFLIGLDAKWKNDEESGKLMEIAGSAEAFYDFNDPRAWEINLGKQPLEQRIQATFARGFRANSYFMLNARRLALGVWIGKQESYRFGPVSARLEAWLDANAVLSFHPVHLHAALWLHGLLAVSVWKLRLGIGLDARLEADVFTPFHILGTLRVRIETRLKDFEFEIRLEWGPQAVRPEIPGAFRDAGIAHRKTTAEWPLLTTGNPAVVPMDGRPYLTFEHPVHDAAGIGTNPAPDPGWVVIGDPSRGEGSARVRYELRELALERRAGSGWQPVAGRSSTGAAFPRPLYGSWAAVPPNPGAGGAAAGQDRLMVWAKTPFELTDGSASWNPWIADNLPSYPCPVVADERICIDWETASQMREYPSPFADAKHPDIVVRWEGRPRFVMMLAAGLDGQHAGLYFPVWMMPVTHIVYAVSESNGTVAVIDTAAGRVIGSIRVGRRPMAIAFSPDGAKAMVSNYGDSTVSVIDTATSAVLGQPIAVGENPWDVIFSGDGAKAYVTSTGTRTLSVIDVQSLTVSARLTLPDVSEGLAILPDGSKIYVVHPSSSALSVIDPATDKVIGRPIRAPGGPRHMVITGDGRRAYVAGSADNQVHVLDTTTDTFTGVVIPVGDFPRDLTIAPDGSRVFVANGRDNTVSVIDTAAAAVIALIPVGVRPFDITITPDGTRVYVAHGVDGTVMVIDPATLAVSGPSIPVGGNLQGIAASPMPRIEPLDVFIDVPPGTAVVEVLAWWAEGTPAPEGQVVEPAGAAPQTIAPVDHLLRFDAAALGLRQGIGRVRIRFRIELLLLRICIVRPAVAGGLAEMVRVHEQLERALSVWGEPGEVLAPFTEYRLRASVQREVEGMGKLGGWRESAPLTLTRTFRTGGPPGLAGLTAPARVDPEKSGIGLADLTRYVAQTVPPTLTPPNTRPQLSRPVFRAYDVGVEFNEDYVDRMYELAGRDLAVQIYDADDRPVRGVGGGLAVLANPWGDAAEVKLDDTRKRWLELLDIASCIPVRLDPETFPRNKTLAAAGQVLGGNTLYEVRLVPLLVRAPVPGGDGWSVVSLTPGISMLTRTLANPDPPAGWTDILVRVVVQPAATEPVGVAFRLGPAGRYELTIDAQAGRRLLSKVTGGVRTKLHESAFAYDANEPYRLAIEATGPRLRVEQDGEPVCDLDDAAFAAGGLGLFPWAANSRRFRDLSVYDFRKAAPVAYRFQLTTSDYVDFFHQIHSFQDETWPGTLPAGLDLAALVVRGKDLSAPAPEDEARAYAALAGALLGPAARQLPRRLEVTRVEQGGTVPALLVRGSEPIDWRRSTLAVSQGGVLPPAAVPPGVLKLTDTAFGEMQAGGDTVTVLLREALDPTGHRIEVRLPADPLALDPAAPAAGESLVGERFEAGLSDRWSFEEEGEPGPAWEVRDGEMLAPLDRGAALGAGLDGAVHALALAGKNGNDLYVAGAFQQAGGAGARRVAHWDGTAWSPLGVGLNGPAYALAAVGEEIYVGGSFNRAGGQPAARVAVWNLRTQTWSPLGAGVNGTVRCLAIHGDFLYAGGQFTTAGGLTVNRVARWHRTTRTWSALGSGMNGEVSSLAVVEQTLYAGGSFTSAGGAAAGRIARWNGSAWSALSTGVNGAVLALAGSGRELWAGGTFTQAGGTPAGRLARWNGRRWFAAGAGTDGPVRGLALSGDDLYVAGGFLTAGGAAAHRVARWSRSRSLWSSVAGGTDGEVRALAAIPGGICLAGDFSAAGRITAARAARIETGKLRTARIGEPVWDDYRLAVRWVPGAAGTTDLRFREQSPDRFYALRFEAERGQVRLIKVLGGQEMALWQSSWAAAAGQETQVTIDCLGERLAGYRDGDELFHVVDADLPAGRIALSVRGETGTRIRELGAAAPVWVLWYAFEEERRRAAGTRFEVHAADAAPALPPPEPGIIRKWIGTAGYRPPFPVRSVDLRCVAPDGRVEHARRFLTVADYVPVPVDLMRNADGTGFFLLPAAGSAFDAGSYRLSLTYVRDKTGVSPVLSRAGSQNPERVAIDIPCASRR